MVANVFQSASLVQLITSYQDGLDASVHFAVLSWPSRPSPVVQATCLLKYIQHSGGLTTLTTLYRFRRHLFTPELVQLAASMGQLDVLNFLSAQAPLNSLFSKQVMDDAASNGSLAVVEFLHANRPEGCSTMAMDQAAANGHLEIVKFLHNHRKEGCTTEAMDRAAANGHLEIVKYLHDNRTEGCSSLGLKWAIEQGHMSIVQFLFDRYGGNLLVGLCCAASRGHLEIVKYFCARQPESKRFVLDIVGATSIYQQKYPQVAAYLRQV
ncbi:unnamed protein product [Aphanomyces euteiches]|uniref:Uncharacterized protein n=1 Tax=Aphanomyces euteiches TaxID=100861 RepID=A0A6G0WFW5_9STRA|nr:hypothetical protein Ae201684_015879 [Aphanomyces euteiches]KAH9080129.1 hypothetical protein Ae201684P_009075 [Aphanomyces euteiches]